MWSMAGNQKHPKERSKPFALQHSSHLSHGRPLCRRSRLCMEIRNVMKSSTSGHVPVTSLVAALKVPLTSSHATQR